MFDQPNFIKFIIWTSQSNQIDTVYGQVRKIEKEETIYDLKIVIIFYSFRSL